MPDELSPDPILLDDCTEPTEELLQINKSLLLDMLLRLKRADSLVMIRRGIMDLQNQVHNLDSDLHGDAGVGDTAEFTRTYLIEELEQISTAQTIERAIYYIDRLIKSVTEIRTNTINDINLNRWKEYQDVYTDSLWVVNRRDSSGAHTAGYWGNFIPQIPHQMMRRYTKRGDWVLDTFAGSGTTLIEGQRLGRHVIGVELRADVVAGARRLIDAEPNAHGVVSDIILGDSAAVDYRALLARHSRTSAQLVIMHPPYFDIIKFSDHPRDLSNAESIDSFLEMIGQVIDNVAPVLDRGRYLALVIGDKYTRGEWIPLGFRVMNEVLRRDFALKSIIVKNFEETTGKRTQKELWKYRALVGGFYIFKHEYIFVFRKR